MRERILSTDVVARMFCALFLAFMAVAAITTRTTVPARVVLFEGHYVYVVFLGMAAISLAILVDIVVNSILPDRYEWAWVKRNRDLLYTISGLLALLPSWYVAKRFGLSPAAGILYLGSPLLIFWLGLCDIRAKHHGKEGARHAG